MSRRDWVYFEADQPTRAAWKALCAFADAWNAAHESRWTADPGELCLRLPGGLDDPERGALEQGLAALERAHRIVGLEAVAPPDVGPAALERAAYVSIVGGGPPSGLVVNELEAYAPPVPCPRCGRVDRARDAPLVGPLELDERRLESGPGTDADVFNLAHGGRLVTRRFADALRDAGATGYRLVPVRSRTGEDSERHFVLAATHVALEPCVPHAPRDRVKVCPGCDVVGGTLERFHVPRGEDGGLSVLSRHRFGLADLHFARETYAFLRARGLRGISPSVGFDVCEAPSARPPRPAETPAVARFEEPSDAEGLRTFLAHLEDPRPRFVCGAAGDRGPERTFEVAHLVEPGCSSRAFDEVERALPEARALRGLYTRANGLLLYCQEQPRTFPTFEAMRSGDADDPSFLRFEKLEAWPLLREELLEYAAHLGRPFVAERGVPFARLTASSDLLVCWRGAVYYFSPGANRYHDQRIARSVGGLLGRIVRDPAAFLMDTASVARFYGPRAKQYVPRRYVSGG